MRGTYLTKPERLMKEELDRRQLVFSTQLAVRTGFILDFAFPEKRLGIEVDGEHWHSTGKQKRRDNFRTHILHRGGWKIIRFPEAKIYEDAKGCGDEIEAFLI